MVTRVLDRAQAIVGKGRVVLAIPHGPTDKPLAMLAAAWAVPCLSGARDDVLARFAMVAQTYHTADTFVRLTADCPLLDVGVSRAVLGALTDDLDLVHTGPELDGLDTEVFTRHALMEAHRYATDPADREHVTPWMRTHLRALHWTMPDFGPIRWSVDDPHHLAFVRAVYQACRLCAEGVPHHTHSVTSIGGGDRRLVLDLHAVSDSGGVGLAECTASSILAAGPGCPS